ncbi:MAG: phosphatase PAP2 family protein [Lachnospira sp.]
MNILKKNWWRALFGLYVLVYLPWFFYLENKITLDYPGIHIINGPIDDKIPFIEIFIIPYLLWFFYVVISCVYMFINATNKEFIQFALSLIIGMSVCMIICMIYPNGLTLRPEHISDSIFGKLIKGLYATDTSTNVLPSIHVYNSLAVHIALAKCQALKGSKKKEAVKVASLILCILICLSTMFLKQHSVYDVIAGCLLMCIMYIFIYLRK